MKVFHHRLEITPKRDSTVEQATVEFKEEKDGKTWELRLVRV